jgi:hypothetical protein
LLLHLDLLPHPDRPLHLVALLLADLRQKTP